MAKKNYVCERLVGVNFSEQDLSYADFTGADLRNAHFEESVLNSVNFSGATLTGANFLGATLNNSRFHSSDITYCNFNQVKARGTSFQGAIAKEATVKFATMFSYADLSYASFDLSRLSNCFFKGATLNHTDFSRANINNSGFMSCGLKSIIVNAAAFRDCDFSQIEVFDVSGSIFRIERCSFKDASIEAIRGEEIILDCNDFEGATISKLFPVDLRTINGEVIKEQDLFGEAVTSLI